MATIINFYQIESQVQTIFSSNTLKIAMDISLMEHKIIAKFRIKLKKGFAIPKSYTFCTPQQIKNIEDQERQKGNFIY